jgi:putative membrane protein
MSLVQLNTRSVIACIIIASIIIIGFLIWLIYFKHPPEHYSPVVTYLPAINALLNSMSAICLCCGLASILKHNKRVHMMFMICALVFSALFLISYLIYHYFHGDTPFPGSGAIRPVYFFILISHILLSIVALPLILITFLFALKGKFAVHKKVARITLPIWLYVSVTGVIVFLLLNCYTN